MDKHGFIDLGEQRLEVRRAGPLTAVVPTLVLLHEGLGSAALWGGFPEQLAAATGLGVVAYSRAGYGGSSPVSLPRPLSYMHDEAHAVLPRLLDAIGVRHALLVGHSDGASIAAIYAGSRQDFRVRGLTLIAPHFFVEEITLAAIAQARAAYASGPLREKLARWHAHVDIAFRGWSDAWLDPAFRRWDITDHLPFIRIPVQIIQGTQDQYGTLRQIAAAEDACLCPLEVSILAGVGHAPHREAAAATVAAIAAFARDALA